MPPHPRPRGRDTPGEPSAIPSPSLCRADAVYLPRHLWAKPPGLSRSFVTLLGGLRSLRASCSTVPGACPGVEVQPELPPAARFRGVRVHPGLFAPTACRGREFSAPSAAAPWGCPGRWHRGLSSPRPAGCRSRAPTLAAAAAVAGGFLCPSETSPRGCPDCADVGNVAVAAGPPHAPSP